MCELQVEMTMKWIPAFAETMKARPLCGSVNAVKYAAIRAYPTGGCPKILELDLYKEA
jgi:hypothetical protein